MVHTSKVGRHITGCLGMTLKVEIIMAQNNQVKKMASVTHLSDQTVIYSLYRRGRKFIPKETKEVGKNW